MKVLLINPNYRKVFQYVSEEATMIYPPLGLAYVASYLRDNGVYVDILDANSLNLEISETKEKVESFKPDVLGITAATNTIEEAFKIAKYAVKKDMLIVIGGPHPSLLPKETLSECDAIDVVAIGEGELTMLELCQRRKLEEIDGIYYRKNGNIVGTPPRKATSNLNNLPFPARDLLPQDKYYSPGITRYPFATLITSRGCPYKCNFCVSFSIYGRKVRFRSAGNVLVEIDFLVKKYGIKELNILDDNYTLNVKRVEEICEGLIERNYDLIWKLGNGVRADSINEALLNKMREAGCYLIAFGIESGSQEILDKMKKKITLEQINNAVKWAKNAGIITEGFFIIGNYGDTKETMLQTVKYAKELDLDFVQFQVYIPFPGAEYSKIIEKEGRIFAKSWSNYHPFRRPIFEHGDLTPELMSEMQEYAYKSYYIRPKILLRKIREIKSLRQLKAYFNAFIGILRYKVREI